MNKLLFIVLGFLVLATIQISFTYALTRFNGWKQAVCFVVWLWAIVSVGCGMAWMAGWTEDF